MDLHAFLESRQDFSTWIKARIEQYGFVDGQDYLLHSFMEQLPSGAKRKVEYHLSLDMAKELSMVERTPKGKQARLRTRQGTWRPQEAQAVPQKHIGPAPVRRPARGG